MSQPVRLSLTDLAAARRRRLTRLRTCALPTRRETTKPKRAGPCIVPSRSTAPTVTSAEPADVPDRRTAPKPAAVVILWARESTRNQWMGEAVCLYGQTLATLETTAADNTSTVMTAHALQEAVYAKTSTALGLPGSLHGNTLRRATLNLAPA